MPIRTETASEQLLSRKRRKTSDFTIVKLEDGPETIPATPAATSHLAPIPATWQHPDELPYIKSGWQDIEIIRFLTANVLTIPAQTHSSGQWVHVLCADGVTVVLPRSYRLPLLWVAKYQWRSLELVLTAREAIRQREWDDAKYEILHIARLCAELVNAARVSAGKGIDRAWRCGLFDRALLRYWHEWLLMRDEFVRHFWYEFGESDFEADVLKRTWAQWVLKDHKGFSLTREEVARGISREQFTEGFFVDEAAGTFEWIEALPDPPDSPLTSADELEEEPPTQAFTTAFVVDQSFPAYDPPTVKTEIADLDSLPCPFPQQHPPAKEDVVIRPCQQGDIILVDDVEMRTDVPSLEPREAPSLTPPASQFDHANLSTDSSTPCVVPPPVSDWGTTDFGGCPLSPLTDQPQDVRVVREEEITNRGTDMQGVAATGDDANVEVAAPVLVEALTVPGAAEAPRDSSGATLDLSRDTAFERSRGDAAPLQLLHPLPSPVKEKVPTISPSPGPISVPILSNAVTSQNETAILHADSRSSPSGGVTPLTDLVSMEEPYPITPTASTFPLSLGDSVTDLGTEMGQLRASSVPVTDTQIFQIPVKSRTPALTRSVSAVGAVRSLPSTPTRVAPYTTTRPGKSVSSPRAGRSESPTSSRTAGPSLFHPLRHLIYNIPTAEEETVMDVDANEAAKQAEMVDEDRERSPSKAHIKFVLTLGEAMPPRARKFSHAAELKEER